MAAPDPLGFVDSRRGSSALALRYMAGEERIAVLFHDAVGAAATMRLVAAIASALRRQLAAGLGLQVYESSMPEHPAEPFVYARVPQCSDADGRDPMARLHAVDRRTVAGACGVDLDELDRTERLVAALYRPRRCAFSGVRVISVDVRDVTARSAA